MAQKACRSVAGMPVEAACASRAGVHTAATARLRRFARKRSSTRRDAVEASLLGNHHLHEETIRMIFRLLTNEIPIRRTAYLLCTTQTTVRAWLCRAAADRDRFRPLLVSDPYINPEKLDALLAFARDDRLRHRAAKWIWRTRTDPDFAQRAAWTKVPAAPVPAAIRRQHGVIAYQFPRTRRRPRAARPRSRLPRQPAG